MAIRPEDDPSLTIPELPPEESAASEASDKKARQEERELTTGKSAEELAGEAATKEHDRDQRFRDAFELIAISGLNLTYLALSTVALVWLLHLLLPEKARWLSSADLSHIQTIITAGVLVGVIGNHFKKRLG